jgi:hypothetical protein
MQGGNMKMTNLKTNPVNWHFRSCRKASAKTGDDTKNTNRQPFLISVKIPTTMRTAPVWFLRQIKPQTKILNGVVRDKSRRIFTSEQNYNKNSIKQQNKRKKCTRLFSAMHNTLVDGLTWNQAILKNQLQRIMNTLLAAKNPAHSHFELLKK